MRVEMKWGRWLICAVIAVALGFYRRWDSLAVVVLSVLVITGVLRLWVARSAPGLERRIAKMTPDQRERFLAGFPEAERERWRERLRKIDAGVDA